MGLQARPWSRIVIKGGPRLCVVFGPGSYHRSSEYGIIGSIICTGFREPFLHRPTPRREGPIAIAFIVAFRTMKIAKSRCKRRLATVWLIGSGLLFFLLLFQTFLGRYGDDADAAWGWMLPTTMPTLMLIVGVLVSDALRKSSAAIKVDQFIFRLAFYLSIAYLAVVSMTLLLSPFSTIPQLELMTMSNLWLGPFQGLVSASLGAFFVNRELSAGESD